MKAFRAHLSSLCTAAALALIPRAAMAVQCNVAHTFITGEPLVQNVLNANPQQFASCLANIDYRNMGASGIFASQIIPQSAAQATFGGTFPYTFSLPPNFSQPLPITSGGTGTNNGIINNVRLSGYPGTTIAYPGLSAIANTTPGVGGYGVSLDVAGYNPLYIGNYSLNLPSINLGIYGGWAAVRGDGISVPTSDTAVNRTIIQAGQIVMKNAVQSMNMLIRASGNLAFYDNTHGRQSNTEIDFNAQRVRTDGVTVRDQVNVGRYYTTPFDAQSISDSKNTHMEHGSDTAVIPAGQSVVCKSYNFTTGYTATPDIQVTPYTGGSSRVYVGSRGPFAVTICVNSGIFDTSGAIQNVATDQTIGYGWVTLGE